MCVCLNTRSSKPRSASSEPWVTGAPAVPRMNPLSRPPAAGAIAAGACLPSLHGSAKLCTVSSMWPLRLINFCWSIQKLCRKASHRVQSHSDIASLPFSLNAVCVDSRDSSNRRGCLCIRSTCTTSPLGLSSSIWRIHAPTWAGMAAATCLRTTPNGAPGFLCTCLPCTRVCRLVVKRAGLSRSSSPESTPLAAMRGYSPIK